MGGLTMGFPTPALPAQVVSRSDSFLIQEPVGVGAGTPNALPGADLEVTPQAGNAVAIRVNTSGVAGGSFTLGDALNVILGTTTGTKFGTSSLQKLGFFGTNPVVRPAVNAASAAPPALYDQTFTTTLVNLVNSLRSALLNVGLAA